MASEQPFAHVSDRRALHSALERGLRVIGFAFECNNNNLVMIDLQKYFAFFVCYISICDGCSIAFYSIRLVVDGLSEI